MRRRMQRFLQNFQEFSKRTFLWDKHPDTWPRASVGKVLKALAGAGIIHAPGSGYRGSSPCLPVKRDDEQRAVERLPALFLPGRLVKVPPRIFCHKPPRGGVYPLWLGKTKG